MSATSSVSFVTFIFWIIAYYYESKFYTEEVSGWYVLSFMTIILFMIFMNFNWDILPPGCELAATEATEAEPQSLGSSGRERGEARSWAWRYLMFRLAFDRVMPWKIRLAFDRVMPWKTRLAVDWVKPWKTRLAFDRVQVETNARSGDRVHFSQFHRCCSCCSGQLCFRHCCQQCQCCQHWCQYLTLDSSLRQRRDFSWTWGFSGTGGLVLGLDNIATIVYSYFYQS